MPATKHHPVSWEQISKTFGPEFVGHVRSTLSKAGRQEWALPMRHFLGWLNEQDDVGGRGMVQLLADPLGRPEDLRRETSSLASALLRWSESLASIGYSPKSVSGYAYRVAASLAVLAQEHPERFPPFTRDMVSIGSAPGNVLTLGSLNWPELSGLSGAARERKALDLVRSRATELFLVSARRFAFGHALVGKAMPPDSSAAVSVIMICSFLLAHRANWAAGRLMPPHDITAQFCSIHGNAVLYADAWVDAGLPVDCLPTTLDYDTHLHGRIADLYGFLIDCLGPSSVAQRTAMLAFCCDTGWNLQPILDLPRQPFIYQTKGETGIATAAFVSSFKNRSNNDVLAYLESHEIVAGTMEENVRAEWRATANAEDPGGTRDGYAVLKRLGDASCFNLLRRFQHIADAARPFDVQGEFGERFFFYMGRTLGVHDFDGRAISQFFEGHHLLGRPGITFQAIRKTFLAVTFDRTRSGNATSRVAGHRGFGTLPRHYLSSTDLVAELNQSIRFFQEACQSMLLKGRSEAVIALGLSPEDTSWFQRLAQFTGISAALSRTELDVEGAPASATIAFNPSEKGLEELFIIHRALRMAFLRVSRQRWRVQGIPLLAAVKAIGRTVCANKGLGSAYFAAARRASAELASGAATLPPLLEI